jgi:branched-chain amino acid transport system permease protein
MSGYYAGVIILTCVNLLAVLGLSLLTGFTGPFCFGQAGFMAEVLTSPPS